MRSAECGVTLVIRHLVIGTLEFASWACFLGIDIGTSGTKTLAIDERGKILAEAIGTSIRATTPSRCGASRTRRTGGRRRSTTVRAVVKKAKLKPADVKAIGLSGQMHGSVFLDKNGKVIRQALLWNDQRTAAECDEIEAPRRRPQEADPDGRQPGPHRLHRPENPLAAEPRAQELRQDWPRCCCPRTTSAAA